MDPRAESKRSAWNASDKVPPYGPGLLNALPSLKCHSQLPDPDRLCIKAGPNNWIASL